TCFATSYSKKCDAPSTVASGGLRDWTFKFQTRPSMISWLKRFFGRGQNTAPPLLATHRASETEAAPFAVNVSVSGPDTGSARFRSPALAQLWQKVGGISHPQHPFLD